MSAPERGPSGFTAGRLAVSGALAAGAGLCTLLTGTGFNPRLADLSAGEHLRVLAREPALLLSGIGYALPLFLALLVHEGGHLVAARRWGVAASPPYCIPGPPFVTLGTFGAFIRLRSPVPNRRALLQLGAWGPFAGFAVSIAAAVAGFLLLRAGYREPADFFGANVRLPGAYRVLRGLILGRWEGEVLYFENPVLAASWLGLFFQGLNLLPVGQLDGGHISYALSRRLHFALGLLMMLSLGASTLLWEPQWFLWLLLLALLGLRHPPCLNEHIPLTARDRWGALAALAIFLLTFHPAPFAF